jgi:hypothetical protein
MNRMRDEVKIPLSRQKMAKISRKMKSRVNCDIILGIKKMKRHSIEETE